VKIVIAPEAFDDINTLVEYIAQDRPVAAQRLADQVFDVIDRLAARDFEGPEHVLRSGETVRSWPVPPLRIYYLRESDNLVVLRVYHHTREPIIR